MLAKILFCFCVALLHAEEIEIKLKTASDLSPAYLSRIHTEPGQFDWRYFQELRAVLENDFAFGGLLSIVPVCDEWEEHLQWPEVKKDFPIAHFRRENIPFVFAIRAFEDFLQLTAFHVEKEMAKCYPQIRLSGRLEEDRRKLHQIADTIHKDLFGVEGVSFLRLIYSHRVKDLERSCWVSEIWMSDYDGYNAKQMTSENNYCVSPFFFPHTSGEVNPFYGFVSYKQGQSKIYCSGKDAPLFELRGNQVLPAMNARGSQMAFISDVAGRPDVFIQNFAPSGKPVGKSRQLFSAPRATQASPTFSPNGDKLAFVSDKDGPPRIYVIDVLSAKDTKRIYPQLITKKNRENTSPCWSPDGKKLCYSAKEEGVRQIWIYDFETDTETPLTTGPENKENPAWAPDNLHLIYNTEHEEEGQLVLIHLKHKEPIPITKGMGQKRFASWESR